MKYLSTAFLLSLVVATGCKDDAPTDSNVAVDDSTPNEEIDADGDGFPATEDCDDENSGINPGATEICDGVDNNCDGNADEGVTTTYYQDYDNDGFGDNDQTVEACEPPEGYGVVGNDCDDGEANAYPGAEEICDGIDNNCDGEIDEEVGATYYADTDGDGYGDPETAVVACSQPTGYTTNADDCDDNNVYAYPGASEQCDEADNDCDAAVDEGVTTTYWIDLDADGFGDTDSSIEACSQPTGYADVDGDCDDGEALANPDETEVCDSIDNNCDGTVDEDTAADASTWYADSDGDTYGDAATSMQSCSQPSGYVADNTDCDDSELQSFPGNTEVCDSIDNNCDGNVDEDSAADAGTWYADSDGDTYGDASVTTQSCVQPSGYVTDSSDCDDADGTSYPGGTEVCDNADNDCNGSVDDNPTDGDIFYADTDGDSFGDINNTTVECSLPSGYSENHLDCDDTDAGEPVVADAVNGTTSGSGSVNDPMFYLQDAVDASGTCVLAMNGTYRETVDFSSAGDIHVRSLNGSGSTTIDPGYATCSAASLASGSCSNYGSVLTFASGSNASPTLEGFTVTGGTGEATTTTTSSDCADSSASYNGTLTCTIYLYEFFGGGLYVDGDSPNFVDVIVEDNNLPDFEQFVSGDFEQYWIYSYGGGLYATNSTASFEGVEIINNYADQGGGAYIAGSSSVGFLQTYVAGNEATDGAGMALDAASANLTNSIVAFNDATTDGGGVFQETSGAVTIVNSALAGNSSSTSGTARGNELYGGASTSTNVSNSLLYGTSSNAIAYSAGTTSSSYSGWYNSASGTTYGTGWSAGANDIGTDPRFTSFSDDGNINNDNFTLRSTSPAIDAGNPSSAYNDADGTTNDMGAYGGPNGDW
ncbi:MAG: putative metal-binding motif-containing protein [Alphaproteobacteria bacterium]|nr:putative metal-binding motif-containing protein [Alphaproteobacteria bacterium]MCB9792604.1 putative metal-binding motif-containing protein [Alphaproteobacteria bacterium]